MNQQAQDRYQAYLQTKTPKKLQDDSKDSYFSFLVDDVFSQLNNEVEKAVIEDYLVESGLSFVQNGMNDEEVLLVQSTTNTDEIDEILVELFEDEDHIKSFILGGIYAYIKVCNAYNLEPKDEYVEVANLLVEQSES